MTITSHRGKWRRSSPTNAALQSWSRINWAVNRIWKSKMGTLRFAKKITNNVAQLVQWMRSGPSCPSGTDEQADEKPHASILEFGSPGSWLLDDKTLNNIYLDLANLAQAYIQLRQVRAFKRCTRPHFFASTCKTTLCQFFNSYHPSMSASTCSWLHPFIRKPVRLQRDWKSAIFVSAAGDRLNLDEYTDTQKWTKATWPLLLAALWVWRTSN